MGFNRIDGYDNERYFQPLQFAEKDAYDLRKILTDEDKCNVPREYVSFIVGNDHSREDIQAEIYSKTNPERNTVDTILFYYSGYAFTIDSTPEVFLALPGMSMPEIHKNPMVALKSALPISFLGKHLFRSQSSNGVKNKILLLDCLDSGQFQSVPKDIHETRLRYFTEDRDFNSEDTVALVSMHRMITTKEGKELGNGIFTFDLITGLFGAAMGDRGEVTVNSLIAYLQDTMPPSIQPMRYGKCFPRITLNPMKTPPSYSTLAERAHKLKEASEEIEKSILPKPQRKLRVFLSYSSTDTARVKDIYKKLSLEKGLAPWFDKQNLHPGEDWDLEIRSAIKSSHVVLVCLSKQSITKEGYVQKEIKQALDAADEKPDRTIFIIPLRLEECEVPERLRKWQWLDLFEKDSYNKLLDSLKKRAIDLEAKNSGD